MVDSYGGNVHYREPHAPYDPPAPFDTMFGPDTPLPRALRSDTRKLMALHEEGTLGAAGVEHVVRLYDGNLAYADREVGWLRQALEQAGLWEKTVVIVTADGAEPLPLLTKVEVAGIVLDRIERLLEAVPAAANR